MFEEKKMHDMLVDQTNYGHCISSVIITDQGNPTTNLRQSEFTTGQNEYNVMQ